MKLFAAALVLASLACAPAPPPPARAFYYWRTTLSLSAAEERALASAGAGKLYLRLFDVDAEGDGAPHPVARVARASGFTWPAGLDVVPVVFLRDAAFRQRAQPPAALADQVLAESFSLARELGFSPRELQFDCDWTDATRDAYFAFLQRARAVSRARGIATSATIRLHQIKYRERTGVPPSDRGMLMFYNMGRFSADETQTALFDTQTALKYLARVDDYPLPLDVALPIWSWTLQLRGERVENLLQATDAADLRGLEWLAPLQADRFVAQRNAFLRGALVRAGDVLKVESAGPAMLAGAAGLLAPHLAAAPRTVALFDLSERNLARHGPESLDRVFRALR